MVTPDDPSDDDWSHATAIVRQIVAKRLGGIRLRSSTANVCNGERADECRRNIAQRARVRHALIAYLPSLGTAFASRAKCESVVSDFVSAMTATLAGWRVR